MTIDRLSGRMTMSTADTAAATAWKADELVFDEMPLADIARILSRRYGVKIEVSGSIARKRIYGRFKGSEQGVEHVLQTMAATGAFRFRYAAGGYLLY